MTPRAVAAGLLLVLVTACGAGDEPETVRPLVGTELVEALRDGGHVLYLRHTRTPEDGVDEPGSLGDCSRQRALDDAGRADARELGVALRELDVPVGEVRASPYCRTVDTAELAFGRATLDDGLLPPTPDTEGSTTRALRALLSAVPEDDANSVLVGHLTNLRLLSTAQPDEGGTVVFRPDGEGFVLVGSVPPQGWQELAARE
jgi:phosphohistidine phosphatase SixA